MFINKKIIFCDIYGIKKKVVFPLLFFVVVGSGIRDPGLRKTGSGI
jgi:hypothetical protein